MSTCEINLPFGMYLQLAEHETARDWRGTELAPCICEHCRKYFRGVLDRDDMMNSTCFSCFVGITLDEMVADGTLEKFDVRPDGPPEYDPVDCEYCQGTRLLLGAPCGECKPKPVYGFRHDATPALNTGEKQ